LTLVSLVLAIGRVLKQSVWSGTKRGQQPDDAKALLNLGNALSDQRRFEEADAAYREVIRLEPNAAEAHYGLGRALRAQGKVDEAIAAWREVIRVMPADAVTH